MFFAAVLPCGVLPVPLLAPSPRQVPVEVVLPLLARQKHQKESWGPSILHPLPAKSACTPAFVAVGNPLPGAGNSPSVLILSPTRELALQTAGVMEEAGSRCGLKTLCVYGGVPKPPQVCNTSSCRNAGSDSAGH